jgi:ribonucleoside-diphosphate reductase alpha chain
VAAFVAAIEPSRPAMNEWGARFYTELYEGRFIPGGRVLAGAGDLFRLKTLANCFVSRIDEDSIDSIYQTAFQCARTYSYGGGIGVDVTPLRPRNAVVHNAADCSTGAVSFMELFSMTTGLIGQSGRRGALMLTIDVKHPDILDFIRVKKDPSWVTRQIVEQCRWSGKFDEAQLKEVEKQVAENTQVRFANISIKACDEFMAAVEEQKKYGEQDWLVYRKQGLDRMLSAPQEGEVHYSVGIPSRPLENYEMAGRFSGFAELSDWVARHCEGGLDEASFTDPARRDVYGDVLLRARSEDADFEYAIRQSGDFLLYFANKASGETRRLVKAREIWDVFVEGNYRTAEPGLIFWTTMSRSAPATMWAGPSSAPTPVPRCPWRTAVPATWAA